MASFTSSINSIASYNAAQYSQHSSFTPPMQLGLQCYIVNLLTNTTVVFNSTPDSIQESISMVMNQISIQGRSDPLFYYSSTGPRSVTFTLPVFDELTPSGIVPFVNNVRAIMYPTYSGYVINSPKIYMKLGNFISILGFCENLAVDWQPTPINDSTFQYADVTFTFNQATIFPYDAYQVQQGALS